MIRLRRPRSPLHLARRVAAVLLALGALVLAVRPPADTAVAGPHPRAAPVVVAATDLPPGTLLTADALRLARLPPGAVPAGTAASPEELSGRVLAGPVRRGEPVTDVRLVGPGLTALLAPGQVAAPLRLPDLAVAGLAHAGDRVDVLATAPGAATAEVVVAGALVLAPSAASAHEPADDGHAPDGLLLLAVDEATGARLAAAATTDTLSITMAPG